MYTILELSWTGFFLVICWSGGSSFQGVGFNDPSHDESSVYAVSADGTRMIGLSQLVNGVAPMEGGTIWQEGGSFEFIPSPGTANALTYPGSISSDGTKVVGTYYHPEATAFSWITGEGSSYLTDGGATAMSSDGSIICGAQQALVDGFSILAAWRIANGEKTFLGGFPQTWAEGRSATAITPDGSFIAGVEQDTVGIARWAPYVWNEQTGFEYLSSPANWTNMHLSDISDNANVAVGRVLNGTNWEAVVWRRGQAGFSLGDFPGGGFDSGATAVSPGGNLVVGFGETDQGREAFLWHSGFGFQPLKTWLEEKFGLDLTGWVLQSVQDFSANGQVLVGNGINPGGLREGWVLRLDGALIGLVNYLEDWDTGEVSVLDLIRVL